MPRQPIRTILMPSEAAQVAATESRLTEGASDDGAQPDSVSFRLRPDGRIASWNELAEKALGYSTEEALGLHFAWFFPADEVQRGESERVLRAAAEDGFHQWEGAWLRKDHSRYWAWVGILAVRRHSGQVERYTVITRICAEKPRSTPNIRLSV